MAYFLKLFSNNNNRLDFEESTNYQEPYVSSLEDDMTQPIGGGVDFVHYNKEKPIMCTLFFKDGTISNIHKEKNENRILKNDIYLIAIMTYQKLCMLNYMILVQI